MDIIDRIDAVTAPQCGWCGAATEGEDYCNEKHQELWAEHFRRTGRRTVTGADRIAGKAERHAILDDAWAKHHAWFAVEMLGASTVEQAVQWSRQRGVKPFLLGGVREAAARLLGR